MAFHRWLWLGCFVFAVAVAPGEAAFSSRTAEERARALGELRDVAPEFRVLLSPDEDFELIRMPEPGDWLDRHVEAGQTFGEFRVMQRNQPDGVRGTIYLLPLGEFEEGSSPALREVAAYAAAFFQLKVKVLPAYVPGTIEFDPRVNPQTKQVQVHAGRVLAFLKTRLPEDAFCVLGITMRDLYPKASWNYVFGQASLRERVGVYSFARYDPDFFEEERPDDWRRTMLRRSCKVLAHEGGHMFGLMHCIYYDCVLNGSNHLAEADAKPMHLCPVCLRKLQHSVGFDPVRRYRELAKFYRKQKWITEAEWCERQGEKAERVVEGGK